MEPSAALLQFPQQPEDRLRLALRRLEEALTEQARTVKQFRGTLGQLRQTTDGLAAQLHGYQAALDGTAGKLQQANETARELERKADHMGTLA